MTRETLTLEPIADDPEVGRWLAAMQGARNDTLRELGDLSDVALDWRPSSGADSIGTILYHVALVEVDWLLVDILGTDPAPAWAEELFPDTDRSEGGQLTPIAGLTLTQHLERLAAVRTQLLEHLRSMPVDDFIRARPRADADVSPVWVIHHLLQHEAEHRSQIGGLKAAHQST